MDEHFIKSLDSDPHENKVIAEQRVKIEIRSWFLRASLAVNVSLVTGLIVYIVTQVIPNLKG